MFFSRKEKIQPKKADVLISHEFISSLVDAVSPVLGVEKVDELWRKNTETTLGFSTKNRVTLPADVSEESLRLFAFSLVGEMSHIFGKELAENNLRNIFQNISAMYDEKTTATIFHFIAKGFLEDERLKYLSKEELERLVKEKEGLTNTLLEKEKELLHANEQLRALDQIKNEFVSVAAHQLRTPLSGIKWTLKLLLDGDLGALNADQKEFLKKSSESNDRLIALVNDMLNVDQIRAGKIPYNFEETRLSELVKSVLYDLTAQTKKREQTIHFEESKDAPLVHIDVPKMRAVLQNLLENAIKYTGDKGVIHIGLKSESDHVTVSVQDSGIGIPEDEKKLLFRRFFRATNAKKMEADGSGLGLFFIRKIIEEHGGKIWFDSKEGEGATFYFTIPLTKK